MKIITKLLFFFISFNLNAEWSDVRFVSQEAFSVNFEKYDTPLVFEWGILVGGTRSGSEDWGYLFGLKNARHMIDRGVSNEQLLDDFLYRFEDGYYDGKLDRLKENFFEKAQTITQEEYEESFAGFRFTSVYGKVGVRDSVGREWAFLLIEHAAEDYMTYFPESLMGPNPEGVTSIFLSRKKDGRYVLEDINNSSIPVYVRNMNYRYLSQISEMIRTGFAYFPKGSVHIESLNPMAAWERMRSN